MVKFRGGVSEQLRQSARQKVEGTVLDRAGRIAVERWKLPPGADVEVAIDRLLRTGLVDYVEQNWKVEFLERALPDDPLFDLQWHFDDISVSSIEVGGASYPVDVDIDAPEAWGLPAEVYWGSRTETVGVLDSGCGTLGYMNGDAGYHANHEDLPDQLIFRNTGETLDGIDNDSNDYVDDLGGWDWFDSDNTPADSNPADDGHGTFISGITSAGWGNNTGVSGAGRNIVKVLPLRGSYVSDLINGIGYAADLADRGEDVHLLNASWKVPGGPVQSLEDAIADAGASGILFVAAAGNDGSDNDLFPVYPSSYSTILPNVLSVAASDPTGDLADFSNYGLSSVHMAAPGDSVVSVWQGTEGYAVGGGTSFAAPIAASAAALVFAAEPGILPAAAIARIEAGGDFDERLSNRLSSSRRINLAGALAPFHPYSGLMRLDSVQPLWLYEDPVSTSWGPVTGGRNSDDDVAVLSGGPLDGWGVSPVGPGIASFTLSFGSSSHGAGSYETGPWRVTAIVPFSEVLDVHQYVDFDALAVDGNALEWTVEVLEGAGVGTINHESGFFLATNPGRVRVALYMDNTLYDHSGPVRVMATTNLPPTVTITGGPAGIITETSASFTWTGTDPDGSIAGYFHSIDTPTDPDTWTALTSVTLTNLTAGDHVFYLRAEDSDGAVSDVSSYPFTVAVANEPPTVDIISGPSGVISTNSTTFAWSASDQDGTVAGYYYSLDEPYPTNWTTGTAHTFTGLTVGPHTFYVMAEDDLGLRSAVMSSSFEVAASSGDGGNGKCFIATVLEGTALAANLPDLRQFRDKRLKASASGRRLVGMYYHVSPLLAGFVEGSDTLKTAAQRLLEPILRLVINLQISAKGQDLP